MPYDELQAALTIARLQRENAELRVRLGEARELADQRGEEIEQLKKRLEELEREAARQAAPFRRRERKKVDPTKKKRPGRKTGHVGAYRTVPDHTAAHFAEEKSRLTAWMDRLLDRVCTQSGDIAVQNRLLKQQTHLLGCLEDTAAEPTNNRAERALRPAVIARKLSCGNKTDAGRQCWQILASLAASCDGLSADFVDFLAARLPLAVQAG